MGSSRYPRAVAALCAAFALLTVGHRLGRGTAVEGCQVRVQRNDRPAAAQSLPVEDGWPDSLLPGERIDLNTAGFYDLQRLPGIGEKRAQDILDYRDQYGPFQSIDQLDQVSGIGEKTLDSLRDYAAVSGEKEREHGQDLSGR